MTEQTESVDTQQPAGTMMKGVLTAAGIAVGGMATLGIPVVHFFLPPLVPFIAGIVGGGVARADQGKIVTFGLYVGGLMAVPAALLILLGFLLLDGEWRWLLVIAGAAAVPYTWWAVTVGALISYLIRRGEEKQGAG